MSTNNATHTAHNTPRGLQGLFLTSLGVFTVLTFILIALDFYPEPVSAPQVTVQVTAAATSGPDVLDTVTVPESPTPVRITIESVDVDTVITSPLSTDVSVLDRALQHGAVRYPGSADLGASANMLIFGHSSYLPVVHNGAYQAFNDLSEIEMGALITVESATHEYTYRVQSIRHAQAEDALIEFTSAKPMLTLATCDTFGAKQDRWIVTAELISTTQLPLATNSLY